MACFGGQTGTEGTAAPSSCERTTTELAANEISPLGFSAEAVRALVEGEFGAALAWRKPDSFVSSYGPERGASTITLAITPRATAARFVEWRLPGANDGRACPPSASTPAPSVEIDVDASISTEGGALNERALAVVAATSTMQASLTSRLELDGLQGSFSVEPQPPYTTSVLSIDATITRDAMSGLLSSPIELVEGDMVSIRRSLYACWPAGVAYCVPEL